MEQAKADTAKVQAAIKLWESIKTKCQGNYSYKVSFSSWVGFGHETTIVVENNKVTSVTTVHLIGVPNRLLPVQGLFLHLKASTTWKKDLSLEKIKKGHR